MLNNLLLIYDLQRERKYNNIKLIKELYNEVISRILKVSKILDLENPVEVFALYHFLLYNGYLSVNNNFNIPKDKSSIGVDDEIYSLAGATIFSGTAVCRHIASLLKDIYKVLSMENYILTVSTNVQYYEKTIVNHVCNIINYNDQVCIIDSFFKDKDNTKFRYIPNKDTIINESGTQFILSPRDYIFYNNLFAELKINRLLKKDNLEYSEFINIFNNATEKIKSSISILDNFYYSNSDLYIEVNKQMKRVRHK